MANEPDASTPAEPAAVPDRDELEKQFEEKLSGAVLVGSFNRADQPDEPLREDRYTIDRVKKLQNEYWLFEARIQYEGRNLKVPMPLLVRWAGDTPVITVDQVLVPGLGVFTARVLIFDDQYAGTWSAGDHGGQMFGRIVREEQAAAEGSSSDETDDQAESDNEKEKEDDAS